MESRNNYTIVIVALMASITVSLPTAIGVMIVLALAFRLTNL